MLGRVGAFSVMDEGGETAITTERLRLLAPRRGDLDALDEAIAETLPELVRWLPWATPLHGKADTRRYIKSARLARSRRAAHEYVLWERESGTLIGIASIHRIDWSRRSAGLGYWVRRSAWRRGYATEAAAALVGDAFRRVGLHRIEAHVALENRASQRVPEKLGFTNEGIARESELIGGRFLDHIQYSLLDRDILPDPHGDSR
jgi:ribosomal-protein-serine acetyltransferase